MSRRWYSYRSTDGKVKGFCFVKNKKVVAQLAGYDIKDLIIEKVVWNGERFVEDEKV